MSSIGYFTEIEMMQSKIKELENKLEQERQEFREAFMRMKASSANITTSNIINNPFYDEILTLREENAVLREKLAMYE